MQEFIPGQRWLSESQPDLGLGLIEAVEHRRVRVLFPATGERRTYATDAAPLARALFGVGDAVRDVAGSAWTVTGTETAGGILTYLVRGADGNEARLRENRLDPRLRLNRPQQRLLGARVDANAWFRLRLAVWRERERAAANPARGLIGPRISPIPHQLYIAAEAAARAAPRVLLADEVGLGKTIEAGLILHRLVLEERVRRVLILVPESLLHQWLVELLRRFNLRFALFDRARLAAHGDGNPFESEQRVLCSLDLLTADPALGAAARAAGWDLLICDEAHHLHWTPEASSPGYDLVAALAAATRAVLLLTATPEQLGRAGHFGRLRLLDPERFGDYDAFLAEEAGYAPIAALATRVLDGADLDANDAQRLWALLGETDEFDPDEVISRLIDRHGTSRILFRNTRAAITGFPARQLHPYPLAGSMPPATDPARALWPERGWAPAGGRDAVPADDPRLPWLIETLRRLRPAKVLLITAQAATVLALRRALVDRAGIAAAVFHEGMEIVERDRAAAFFADPDEGAAVLLCSEIGSEGRNFQFAHHLILFDLPLDPELLEQRIGRLDRIGQTAAVELHCPYLAGGPAERLFRWYAEGLAAFTAPSPAAAEVNERLGPRLQRALGLAPPDPTAVDDFEVLLAEAVALRQSLEQALAAGRDRLLELASHRPAVSAGLVAALAAEDHDPTLRETLHRFWDAFGIEHEPGRGGATVLRPGAHMLEERFPGLPEEGLTVCFNRAHALAHEDHAFLTREHPLVRAAFDIATGGDLGSSALWLTRDPRFPAGTLLLEVIAVADCPAAPDLGVSRFLPPTALRWLLDTDGRDLASSADPAELRDPRARPGRLHGSRYDPDRGAGRCLHGNPPLARALIEARAAAIGKLIAAGEARLTAALAPLRDSALARMRRELNGEIDRLRALGAVNPGVRPADVAALVERKERLATALAQARLRLDALRLIAFT